MVRYDVTRHMQRKGLENANQLAAFASITVPLAYRVLAGERLDLINCATLESIAVAFRCSPWSLLEYVRE